MKTIFRYTNVALLMAAFMALGAVAGLAQNPCEDADGITALDTKFRDLIAKKPPTIDDRKAAIETGKQFLEKYGACEPTKDFSDYLKKQIPVMEEALRKATVAGERAALTGRFDTALKGKNWDEVYASGKEVLAKYPDELRTTEIVLGSVGGEEAFKGNFKYNDDAVKYAKQSIADLEAGKSFNIGDKPRYGLSSAKDAYNFEYPNKDDAIGWLNLYIGYITAVGKKQKTEALPYLYKATQANSESAKQPVPFELIGSYYFDELNKIVEKIQQAAKEQKDTDTPEVAQKKVDDIKALVALSNGISERAMDAFSRAYTHGKDAAYKAKMKKNVQDAYKVRFAKETGVDEWIASTVAKPFVNPTTPVTPISDPEPAKTSGDAGSGASNGTGASTAGGTGVNGAKTAPTTTTPAATPAKTTTKKPGAKPQAVGTVAKKKGA